MLIKERLSYNDQLDEQSISLAKKDKLIEELRKEIEVHNCTVKTWNGLDQTFSF